MTLSKKKTATGARDSAAKIEPRSKVPAAELERRWKVIREGMKEKNLDFLIMQNQSPIYGGYVRYFTDIKVHSHPTTVIFPRDDEMTIITHGPKQTAGAVPFGGPIYGVKKHLTLPYLLAYDYSGTWGAELAVSALKSYKKTRIGLVGFNFFSVPFYDYLTKHLETAKFQNVTDWIDSFKSVKSAEELKDLRVCCQMQDEIFDYILTIVKPGRMAHEIRADIIGKWLAMGGEETSVGVRSAPYGVNPQTAPPSNKPIRNGDQVITLVETSGPGGQWAEFCRTICLGKVSPELQEQFGVAQAAQKVTLDQLKPGAKPVDLWNSFNAYVASRGFPEERRIYAHGEGYDMMERPSLNPGETMILKPNMNIAVHPEIKSPKAIGWVCENYLVKSRGAPECLHKTPQKIFVL